MKMTWIRWSLAAVALLLLGLTGCQRSPVDSMANSTITNGLYATAFDGPVQLNARVRTTDMNCRMLTLMEYPDTVIALQNCQITRFKQQGDAPIPFDSIAPGDSVEVNGERAMNGYVHAWKIKVCAKADGQYDEAFRDTILSIDYAAGSFTVRTRPETILVDENTVIWGTVSRWYGGEETNNQFAASKPEPFGPGPYDHHTLFAFTDLQEGDIIEVRANRVDDMTLVAVSIKIANCAAREQAVTFESTIASIDVTTRLVTFTDQAWTGWVCPKAAMTGNETSITLADFVVGDAVAVKGVPLDADTLRICQMTKL